MHAGNPSAWLVRIVPFLLLVATIGCSRDNPSVEGPTTTSPSSSSADEGSTMDPADAVHVSTTAPEAKQRTYPERNVHPEVLIKTSQGDIQVRLDAEHAPLTVDNFLENYVDRHFYHQTIFHYVERDFMIAAGGYTPDQQPKPTRAEIRNEAHQTPSNRRGTIAMARHPSYRDSATSQFFINLVDNPSLDHQNTEDDAAYGYCVFGEVVGGMEVVDRIAQVEVSDEDEFTNIPVTPVIIESIERIRN